MRDKPEPSTEGQRLTLQMPGLTKKHMNIKLYKTDSRQPLPNWKPKVNKEESRGLWITKPLLSNQGFFQGRGGDTKEKERRDVKANSKAMGSPSFVTSPRCETQPS